MLRARRTSVVLALLPLTLVPARGAVATATPGVWTVMRGAKPPPSVAHWLSSVSAVSADEVWAVGEYTPRSAAWNRPLIERYSGGRWSVVPGPSPMHTWNNAWLTGVVAISADDVWAVGGDLLNQTFNRSRIEHWDGARWSSVRRPRSEHDGSSLVAVAASGRDDVWAVGSTLGSTLAEHWDGTGWNVVATPNPIPDSHNRLFGLSVVSPTEAYAVGTASHGYAATHGPSAPGAAAPNSTFVLRWNGTRWKAMAMGNVGGAQGLGIARLGSQDVWMAGLFDSNSRYAAHFDGVRWASSATQPVYAGIAAGVAGSASNDVWLVGERFPRSQPAAARAMVQHWDGTAWSIVRCPSVGSAGNELRSVSVKDGTVWAVGTTDTSGQQAEALIERYVEG